MRPAILIVGQGLAGTLLAWELERAAIPFVITDWGHERAATVAAAGIINPITGRRLVKSWRIDALLPSVRATYRELETALGATLWYAMNVRRLFADDRESVVFREKQATGELSPFVDGADEAGFWIRDAARVDLGRLLTLTRARWQAMGRLRESATDVAGELNRYEQVIDCRGIGGATSASFDFVPWEFSKGELLEIEIEGLEADVILNRRTWVVPVSVGTAWVGATHEPGVRDSAPSAAARQWLEISSRGILAGKPFNVVGQRAGVRVNLPDKRPVAGRHPEQPRLGLLNGLGAKGALWAPMLARQWAKHLTEGTPFDSEIDVIRFAKTGNSARVRQRESPSLLSLLRCS